MSEDPKRLVDEMSYSPWSEILKGVAPPAMSLPPAVRDRVHRRVGSSIASGLAASSVAESAHVVVEQGSGLAAEASVASATSVSSGILPAALLKWVGLTVIGGGLTAGTYHWLEAHRLEAQPMIVHEQTKAPAVSIESSKGQAPSLSAQTVTLEDLPFEESEPTPAKSPQLPVSSSLVEEAQLLQKARDVLTSSPEECLRLVRHYQTRFPQGQLGREAQQLILRAEDRISTRGREE